MKLVDMKRTPQEKTEELPTVANAPDYPYGLCISLCEDELEKLGTEASDYEPGEIVHLNAFAMVTSVSQSANQEQKPCCRIELTITHIGLENEDDEFDEEPESRPYF